jgi:GAF domain-containing protein
MQTLLRELINQYFSSSEDISPQMAAFLKDLDRKFILSADGENYEDRVAVEGPEKTSEQHGLLAKITHSILNEIASLNQAPQVLEYLTIQVQEQFGFTKTQLFSYNKPANTLRLSFAAGEEADIPKAQHAILPLSTGAVGNAAAELKTVFSSGSDLHLQNFPHMFGKNTKSQAAIPISLGTELFGVLDVQSNLETGIDQDAILSLETLALQSAILLRELKIKSEMIDQITELSTLQKMASSEGWKTFREMSTLSSSRFVYDQNLSTVVPGNQDIQTSNPVENPLEIRGEVIGALGISTNPDQPLTPEEINLLESISNEVAEALERARLFETSQRSASELAVLNEMGAAFAQAEDEEFITENIYKYTSKLMETPLFYVALYQEDEELISFPFVISEGERVTKDHPEYDQWYSRPADTGLTGYIIQNKIPILLDSDAEKNLEELGLPYLRFGEQTDSWLGVPMILGDRILGVISVQSETAPNLYNRHHLDLLTTIASQAAVAINNTRLFNQEQERAKQERTVRTITDKVRRGTDTRSIMQIALEELSEVLHADVSVIQLGSREQLLNQYTEIKSQPSENQNSNENDTSNQTE